MAKFSYHHIRCRNVKVLQNQRSSRSQIFTNGIRILIPFHFGQPDPDQCSKKQPKSWKISTKINQIIRISYFLKKILNLCFMDTNIYPINNKTYHFFEKYLSRKIKLKFFLDFRFHETDPRIRIHIKMKRINNTEF